MHHEAQNDTWELWIIVPLVVVVVLITSPLWITILVVLGLYNVALTVLVWLLWLPRGKDVFYMSSDSPNWHDYMEENVWPLVADRAVRLNWSERKSWSSFSLATKIARHYARGRDFNPLVVVFRPFRMRQEFRFYYAFRRLKKVGPYEVEALVSDLKRVLRGEKLPAIRNLTS